MIMKKMTILLTLLLPLAGVEVGDVEEDEDVAEVGAELLYQEYAEQNPTFLRILKCCQCLQFKSCWTITSELGGVEQKNNAY